MSSSTRSKGRDSDAAASPSYRTIVADPPWPMGGSHGIRKPSTGGTWGAAPAPSRIPYSTMALDEIAALPVVDFADDNAHLYVWTVNRFLEETYDIVRGWGFRPGQLLTWCKTPRGIGFGDAFTPTTEHILFARRGRLAPLKRLDSTWWLWKRSEHSAKPEAFLDLVESVSPGPYLELFSRRARLGWDTYGDEALHGTGLVA